MNLAVNARDAMPSGGTLTIETATVDLDERYAKTHLAVKPGLYVALTVTDTGVGMTPEVQARLFEPFFTTKEVGKGTGLGLASVHGIVTRNGGSVDVSSEVGRGSSFTVYLPKVDAGDAAVVAPPAAARPHAGAETVLVVDDAAGLRVLTQRLLQRLGYTVLIAADAEEALRVFDENAVDRPAADRCRDAGGERTGIDQATDLETAGAEGDLHVRLHGGNHRPARDPPAGDCVPAQTVHLGNPRPENP